MTGAVVAAYPVVMHCTVARAPRHALDCSLVPVQAVLDALFVACLVAWLVAFVLAGRKR